MEGALAKETVDSSLQRSATQIGMMALDRVSRHADDKLCQSMTEKAHNMTKKVMQGPGTKQGEKFNRKKGFFDETGDSQHIAKPNIKTKSPEIWFSA